MSETFDAFLLTRHWQDTRNGVELRFWATCDNGPVLIAVPQQESVCFVERSQPIDLPLGAQRRPLELRKLGGDHVDGLYFSQQKQLTELRSRAPSLCESDVKPNDRYLMERFVRAGVSITGIPNTLENFSQFIHPKLAPSTYKPKLLAMSLDIEMRANSTMLYSIGVANHVFDCTGSIPSCDGVEEHLYRPGDVVFMLDDSRTDTEQRDGYELTYCDSEKVLMLRFLDYVQRLDPDVITGWSVINFDLDFLDKKCRALNIPFALGRNQERSAVLQPGSAGQPKIARVPGRAVLDGIDLLRAGFWTFESMSLDSVAHELLGTGKLISSDQNKVAEINRQFREDKPMLADYNIRDCQLVNQIFAKADLMAFAVERASLTGLPIDRLGGSVAAFDNLYLPRLHRQGYVATDVGSDTNGLGSPGGYVLDSKPGLYNNVLVLDFKSLYPSIIRTFFVDPLGMANPGEDPVPGFLEANFSRDTHILPGLIEELWEARDLAKKNQNAPLSQAIKIIMNSFYGVLGSNGCRFYSPQLASSITRRGHEIITQSKEWIETQGYEVIYGDTDSLFVLLGDSHTSESSNQVGVRLMESLNQWWTEHLKSAYRLDSHLEVEFETHYSRFFMPTVRGMPTGSKKRYAGLVTRPDSDPDLIVKGLEAARTDWTPLARDFQKQLFNRVFHDEPFEDLVRDTANDLQAGRFDDELVYRKRLRRKLSDYQKNVPPHVQAARKASNPGHWIRYVITRNGPEPADNIESPIDYQHYMEKQLAPAADGILQFLDTSFSTITDAQMSMF
ncbi:MAG: DNA polymerase II [Gammaproteobacteria bacterium]|nr:DNA polymerase II [Gammaproteobacteria bacterium]